MFEDFRFALRTFRRSPGFTLAVLLILGLGIGGNTVIFSVIDGVLLHPIPFPEPDRLVALYQSTPRDQKNAVSYPNLLDWQEAKSFAEIAGVRNASFTLTGLGDPQQVMGLNVSWNLLSVLHTQPLLGRMFTRKEDQRGAQPVVLVGEIFWKRRFAGDPHILGQSLRLNGRDYTVIGVVPASVRLDRAPGTFFNDVFTPLGQVEDPFFYTRGNADNTLGLGRLKPGVALAQARAEMNTIMRNLATEYPEANKDTGVNAVSYREDIAGKLEPFLIALGAAVGFVLLIACANVANLLLARGVTRSQEFGIRLALGAGPGRIVRQLLTESLLLSVAGGTLGVFVASWCTGAILAVLPSILPAISQVQVNYRVLLFSLGLSLATGLLFGVAPALQAGDARIGEILRQGGRGILHSKRHPQAVLIVGEVALTFMLLVGAGLMIRSLQKLWNVNPGFNPNGVVVFYTEFARQRSSSPEEIRKAIWELDDQLHALPGVDSASVDVGGLPFFGNTTIGFWRDGDAKANRGTMRIANLYGVSRDHLQTMGISLVRGRSFTDQDTEKSRLVTVIDQDSANAIFPGQDPIGKFLNTGFWNRPVEIVGVAGRIKQSDLNPAPTALQRAQLYFPIVQLPNLLLKLAANNGIACIVRSKVEPSALLNSARVSMRKFDSERVIFGEQRMTDAITGSLAPRRFSFVVLGMFAAMGLVLSIIGIYGVVSYLVSQRTNEIGVRMVLGAQPGDIFLAVVRDGAVMGVLGVAVGLAGAIALTRLLDSLLFEISATDFKTFSCASFLVLGLTILACYLPARRAACVDPATALRRS